MPTIFQVGAGSGGMVVLDLLCREPSIRRIVLVEPDVYKSHNVHRHYFGHNDVGQRKADLAVRWLRQFRPDLEVTTLAVDLMDRERQPQIETAVAGCDLGVCAVDVEPAKYHFDALMRKHQKPWTLGEVLSGGIGGWVHVFRPGEACYGCVASHLQRTISTDNSPSPDYANPGAAVAETTVPASKAAVATIAGLHTTVTLGLLAGTDPGFTSWLLPLAKVDGVFAEALRPFRFRIPRSPECLICGAQPGPAGEDLDVALDQALARLGHE
ncbi:MAG TPA: ThiF family adenylyltransferase [Gemmataceae bacterium]|nr:ThiF family adenylyltransferase [Gemmataceae bacterium]